jgi:ribosome maturation factor RimP
MAKNRSRSNRAWDDGIDGGAEDEVLVGRNGNRREHGIRSLAGEKGVTAPHMISGSNDSSCNGTLGPFPTSPFDRDSPQVAFLVELAEQAGVALYDVTFPRSLSGILQVVITAPSLKQGKKGVAEIERVIGHEECGRLARLIIDNDRVEELLPGSVTLEVSSPGVNRELKCVEHLQGAVGERVRLVVRSRDGGSGGVIRGELCRVGDDNLMIVDEERKRGRKKRGGRGETSSATNLGKEAVVVPFANLKQARVDFLFRDGPLSGIAGEGREEIDQDSEAARVEEKPVEEGMS